MKKFLGMLGVMLMFALTMTSCHDNDGDEPSGQNTSEQLVGTWQTVSAQGICDLEFYQTRWDGLDYIPNHTFSADFNISPLEDMENIVYVSLYERFCCKIIFTPEKTMTVLNYNLTWDYELNDYIGYWDNRSGNYFFHYYANDDYIRSNNQTLYIKQLTKDKLVLVLDDIAIDEEGSGHSVTVTLKRIE